MKYLALFLLVILTACDTSGVDLRLVSADAQATVQAAEAGLAATRDSITREQGRATMQAAQTAGAAQIEMDLLASRITATADAQALAIAAARVTDTARQADATATAVQAQASRTEQALAVTQTVQAVELTRYRADAARREQWAADWSVLRPLVVFILVSVFVAGIAAIVWVVIDRQARRNHTLSLHGGVVETRAGTTVIQYDASGQIVAYLLEPPRALPPRVRLIEESDADPVQSVGGSQLVWESPIARRQPATVNKSLVLVARLLQDAISISGEGAAQLPSWRKLEELGWSSDRWQRAVKILKAIGAVMAFGDGTFVSGQYDTLGDLLYAVETRQLKIVSPTPKKGSKNE